MAKTKIFDRDLGWNALYTTVTALTRQKPEMAAGVFGDEGARLHPKGGGKTVAEVASRNEFGIGVPERSFLRSTFEKNKADYQTILTKGMVEDLLSAARTRTPFNANSSRGFKRLALRMEADVKSAIAQGIPPPNSPRTIRQKGSSTPLIASGLMRQSVSARVRLGKGKS